MPSNFKLPSSNFPLPTKILTFTKTKLYVVKSCAVRYGWRYCGYRTLAQKSLF